MPADWNCHTATPPHLGTVSQPETWHAVQNHDPITHTMSSGIFRERKMPGNVSSARRKGPVNLGSPQDRFRGLGSNMSRTACAGQGFCGEMMFCWLPPDQSPTSWVSSSDRRLIAVRLYSRWCVLRGVMRTNLRKLPKTGTEMFFTESCRRDALALALLLNQTMHGRSGGRPGGSGIFRNASRQRGSAAGREGTRSGDCVEHSCWPCPSSPGRQRSLLDAAQGHPPAALFTTESRNQGSVRRAGVNRPDCWWEGQLNECRYHGNINVSWSKPSLGNPQRLCQLEDPAAVSTVLDIREACWEM